MHTSSRGLSRLAQLRRTIAVSALVVQFLAPCRAGEPSSPWFPSRPVRELELLTGESLLVENVRCDAEGIEFTWWGQTHCRLPLALIRTVGCPAGWIDHLDEPFETLAVEHNLAVPPHSGRRAWNSARDGKWSHTARQSIKAGELAVWWRCDTTPHPTPVRIGIVTLSANDPTPALQAHLHPQGVLTTNLPRGWRRTFSQSLKAADGWTRLAVVWQPGRCEVHLNGALHSLFETDVAGFQQFSLEPRDDSTAFVTVDDLVLREFDAERAAQSRPVRSVEDQDVITLIAGDQLFGRLDRAEKPPSIALRREEAVWTGSWSEIRRIEFARRPLPGYCLAPVTGLGADLSRRSDAGGLMPLTSLRNVQGGLRTLRHPWLGTVAWVESPSMKFDGIRVGEFRWLEPDRRHLGDEIRNDLSPAIPVGTALGGKIELRERPRGFAWIELDVAELEPSGPATLVTQPFVETLRGGGLRTELVINDRLVTDLNRLLTMRSTASHPERLRIPIPRSAWRAGTNTWAIRQRPLSPSQPQYDDAEVGRIALWIAPW